MNDTFTTISHSKPWITDEDKVAVNDALTTGMIAQGALVKEFENSVSKYLDVECCTATSSGTHALVLALQVLDIGKDSEVILPTYVCRSVLDAVIIVGAIPVICDVGPNWVMTIHEVEPLVTTKTAAIIAVHIFGLAVDVQSLRQLGIPIIEDACQAFGTKVNGVPAGAMGDIGVFSFHATKCLTSAEGGMLVSNNCTLITEAKSKRDGTTRITKRTPAPLSDLQAALGLSQLERYECFLERRCVLREIYEKALSNIASIQLPSEGNGYLFRFPLRVNTNVEILQSQMLKRNVNIRKGVDQLLHRELGNNDASYPNAVEAFRQTVSLPFYPALEKRECKEVAAALREVCE